VQDVYDIGTSPHLIANYLKKNEKGTRKIADYNTNERLSDYIGFSDFTKQLGIRKS
jgi:hypothetical protein